MLIDRQRPTLECRGSARAVALPGGEIAGNHGLRDRPVRSLAHHGAHVFPDLSAEGEEIHQHLYSVVFDAAELWPEGAGRRDRVFLDLWEAYLLAEPS